MRFTPRHPRQKEPSQEGQKEKPFFSKTNDLPVQAKGTPFFQPKLAVGQPGDKYEREADAVADSVVNGSGQAPMIQQKEISTIQRISLATPMEDEKLGTAEARMEKDKLIQEQPVIQRMGTPKEEEPVQMQTEEEEEPVQMQMEEEEEPLQMQPEEEEEPVQMMSGKEEEESVQMQTEEEEEPVQMKTDEEEEPVQMQTEEEEEPLQAKSNESAPAHASSNLSNRIESSRGKGGALPRNTRSEMEASFGVDFSGVNVHTDQQSVQMNKELGAQAFTHGQDVYFNSGKFRPGSADGKHLLAHELTHVVQQGAAIRKKPDLGSMPNIQKDETNAATTTNKFVNANERTKNKVSDAISEDLDKAVQKVLDLTGQDMGVKFGDTTRNISSTTDKAGADNFSWHKTGRAIDFNQGLKWLIVEESGADGTFFRLYLEKSSADVSNYDRSFDKSSPPTFHHNPFGNNVYKKTFIDVTQILFDNGLNRIKAQEGWKETYNKREWWHYEKRDGLDMYEALTQVYTEAEIVAGYKNLANESTVIRMYNEGFPIAVIEKMISFEVGRIIHIYEFKKYLKSGDYYQAGIRLLYLGSKDVTAVLKNLSQEDLKKLDEAKVDSRPTDMPPRGWQKCTRP